MIRVELYGLLRHRAGLAAVEVEARTLGEVFTALGRSFPQLRELCLDGERLRAGYLANLNGHSFLTEPATELAPHDVVMLLSSDVGG